MIFIGLDSRVFPALISATLYVPGMT
jgi:hypothetical protein